MKPALVCLLAFALCALLTATAPTSHVFAAEPTPTATNTADAIKLNTPPLLWAAEPGRFAIIPGTYLNSDGKPVTAMIRLDTVTGRAWYLEDGEVLVRHPDGRMGLSGRFKETWTEVAEPTERIVEVD